MEKQIELEQFGECPICGSTEVRFLFTNIDKAYDLPGKFGLNECMRCQVVYLSPRPTPSMLAGYYPDNYPQHQSWQIDIKPKHIDTIRNLLRNTVLYEIYNYKYYEKFPRIHNKIIAKILSYSLFPLWNRARYDLPSFIFSNYKVGVRALDIGCGTGHFMLILKRLGYETYGIELSKKATKIGKEQFGLDIRNGTLLDHKFPDNYFYLITMNHVLEHLHNPIEVLLEAKRILHPNGWIIIRTPNINSLGYKTFMEDWGPLETPRHLFLYSKNSLNTLTAITGLKMMKFHTLTWKACLYWSLSYKLKKLNKHNIQGHYFLLQKAKINALNLYEKFLITFGKDVGEEICSVLIK